MNTSYSLLATDQEILSAEAEPAWASGNLRGINGSVPPDETDRAAGDSPVSAYESVALAEIEDDNQDTRRDEDAAKTEDLVYLYFREMGASPVLTRDEEATAAALKSAQGKSLGAQTFQLVSVVPFKPDGHKGHKMEARGLLYKDQSDARLNLTSLQMLGATCAN